jgi:transcriptional regulator with XRE-family HTH domain
LFARLQAAATVADAVTAKPLPTLGDVIRQQRELHELSLRQLAGLTGISNPYLSQIEHGLRDPSNAVVDAIADALDVTSARLYDAAGIRTADDHPEDGPNVVLEAIEADTSLKPPQRRALIETYQAFVVANGGPRPGPRSRGRKPQT